MAHRSALEQLPGELQEQIISWLHTDPPSTLLFHRRPLGPLTYPVTNHLGALKQLSLCSSRLRAITIPRLFRHILVPVQSIDEFKSFIIKYQLANVVRSTIIFISNPDIATQTFGDGATPIFESILQVLSSLSTLVIVCPPACFPHLTTTSTQDADAWNFNMPYHNLRLESKSDEIPRPPVTGGQPTVFQSLPWLDFSVNEGSSLSAYTQYEYFMRKPPSLLTGRTNQLTLQLPKSFLWRLRYFSYTAIFPFYNHVSAVMSLIENTMPNLHTLTVCLSPHPTEFDGVIAQERLESSGKIDFHDVWMEFETAYEIIAYHVLQLGLKANLRMFKSLDWTYGGEVRQITSERLIARLEQAESNPPLRDPNPATAIEPPNQLPEPDVQRGPSWHHVGDGTWKFIGPNQRRGSFDGPLNPRRRYGFTNRENHPIVHRRDGFQAEL